MKNILIDTCSWIDILTEDKKTNNLSQLEFWIDNGFISLFTHEIILEEWNKHKETKKNNLEQSMRDKYRHAREVILLEKISVPKNLEPDLSFIETQIKTIDKLLTSAFLLKASPKIKAFCGDRSIARKAPFHTNKFSTKDAYIIFSALDYFNKIKQDFLFISSNKNDFGNPSNLISELHPEITESFKRIKVTYYAEFGKAIHDLKKESPMLLLPTEEANIKENSSLPEIPIDKSKHILEQLFDYINSSFSEIYFQPTFLFTRYYPFNKNSNSFPNYSVFSLTIDNEKIIELFDNIRIKNGQIEYLNNLYFESIPDYEIKIRRILKKLTDNLIFYLHDKTSAKKHAIYYSVKEECECSKCNFNKLKLSKTFEILTKSTEDLKGTLKNAYIDYRLGNFIRSAKLYQKAFTLAEKEKQNINAFIAKYNLYKLGNFIKNYYWGANSHEDLWKELRKINLNEIIQQFRTDLNKDLLEWINDHSFYSEVREEIQTTVSKIRDNYYSQLKGGWSSNSEVWKLINNYAEIDSFLNENYIIYDKYAEFKELTNIFTEGLMASHAIKEPSSRLEHFDDWLLSKLIFYGSSENILRYFSRYNLKKLHYKQVSRNDDKFCEIVNNFFTDNCLKNSWTAFGEQENRTFGDLYSTIFSNILTLISLCDLDLDFYNEFTVKLNLFLKEETFVRSIELKSIRLFIRRIGPDINIERLGELFMIMIKDHRFHQEEFFEAMAETLTERKKRLRITEDEFSQIQKLAFDKCELCKTHHHPALIVPLYCIIDNENFRIEISRTVFEKLRAGFDYSLFYLASIYDVIEFDHSFLDKAITYAFSNRGSTFKSIFFNTKENVLPELNQLLNLCFKYNIILPEETINKFKIVDSYYEWLLDMDKFDYRRFHPRWICEYPTSYYYSRISRSNKTKTAMEKYLRRNRNSELLKYYFDIYQKIDR